MRYGWWRGELFEGYERRRGERQRSEMFTVIRMSRTGNASNPRAGSGAQQTRRRLRGANRRGGEKPRGRNKRFGWHRISEGGFGLREWTRERRDGGGAGESESQERRRPARYGQVSDRGRGSSFRSERSEGEVKRRRVDVRWHCHGGCDLGGSSRTRSVTNKVAEGAGKAKRPATETGHREFVRSIEHAGP